MSTNHHTDTAGSGLQAVYTDVITPDGALDAAIGDFATFDYPVAPTSAIDAANRAFDRNIAKPNVLWDPVNWHRSPADGDWGGLTRWLNPGALSIINPDTANPYKSKTLRMDNSQATAGKYGYLKETMMEPTETMNVAARVKSTAGTWSIGYEFLDGSGVSLGTTTSTAASFADEMLLTIGNISIPANTDHFSVFVKRQSGTASADIYAMWVNPGIRIFNEPTPPGIEAESFLIPLKNTYTWAAGPNLADGANTQVLVGVTNARATNVAKAGLNPAVGGLFTDAQVTANDIVTVSILNKTGAPVNLANVVVKVLVWQY